MAIDKQRLLNLLTLNENEDVYALLGKMEMLIDFFAETKVYHGFLPFLKTYHKVTKKVCHYIALHKDYFETPDKIILLDEIFARKYLAPLKIFLLADARIKPWQSYYYYCEREHNAFVQLLLGINAHINGDLALSLSESKFESRSDYIKVNEILAELVSEVVNDLLINEHDLFAATGFVLRPIADKEFRAIIIKWREDAWSNYQMLKGHQQQGQVKISENTEEVAAKIIDLFRNLGLTNLPGLIRELGKLSVLPESKP
jgi:hypothetical protein